MRKTVATCFAAAIGLASVVCTGTAQDGLPTGAMLAAGWYFSRALGVR